MSMSETQLERFIRSFESMAESLERLSKPIMFYDRTGLPSQFPVAPLTVGPQPAPGIHIPSTTNGESPPAPAPATTTTEPDPEGTTDCV